MRSRSMAALMAMLVSVGLCGGAANATMVGAPAKIVARKGPIVCGYLGLSVGISVSILQLVLLSLWPALWLVWLLIRATSDSCARRYACCVG
jgi:hypothetical protein